MDDQVARRGRAPRGACALARSAAGRPMYESFAQVEVARLEELRLTVLHERIEVDLALGRHAALTAELEKLVQQHPLRDGFRGDLMLALYRSGRQSDALACYEEARRRLRDEMGLDPSPELRELQAAILRQDPGLSVEPPELRARRHLPAPATSLVGRRRRGRGRSLPAATRGCPPRHPYWARWGGQDAPRAASGPRAGRMVPRRRLLRRSGARPRLRASSCRRSPPHSERSRGPAVRSLEACSDHLARSSTAAARRQLRARRPRGPGMSELLSGAPSLQIIVTSRSRLGLYGEHEYPVQPLQLPELRRLGRLEARRAARRRCPVRGSGPGREARLPAHPWQRTGCCRALRATGRAPARHRACRRPRSRVVARTHGGRASRWRSPTEVHVTSLPGTRRCGRRSSGATGCCHLPSSRCSAGWRCSRAAPPSLRRVRFATPTPTPSPRSSAPAWCAPPDDAVGGERFSMLETIRDLRLGAAGGERRGRSHPTASHRVLPGVRRVAAAGAG